MSKNKERKRETDKLWKQNNKDKVRENGRRYYERKKQKQQNLSEIEKLKIKEEKLAKSRRREASLTPEQIIEKREFRRAWGRANRAKLQQYERARRVGLTPEDVTAQYKKQDGKCAICDRVLLGGKRDHLDHCHDSGVFRGILCNLCNTGLGALGDTEEALCRAIAYLEKSLEHSVTSDG